MNTESVKMLGQDYLFENIEDAILKIICYSVSWLGGVLVSKVQGTLTTNQGVFFLFFCLLALNLFCQLFGKREKNILHGGQYHLF